MKLLPDIVKNSKAESTNKKYDFYFSKFKQWCIAHSFSHLPASVSSVALFLGGLVQQKVSSSVLEAYFYSISWYHSFAQVQNPCSDEFLDLILEGGKRILSKPLNKKEPINTEILSKLVDFYTSDENNLLRLRTCVLCLLGFSGFLRFSELSGIRLSHISWHSSHI